MTEKINALAENWFRDAYSNLTVFTTYATSSDPFDQKIKPETYKVVKCSDEIGEIARITIHKHGHVVTVHHRITGTLMDLFGLDSQSAMKICADALWDSIGQPCNKSDEFCSP